MGHKISADAELDRNSIDSLSDDVEQGESEEEPKPKCVNATNIDLWSRFAFPFSFGLFQLIYWIYYWQEKNRHNNLESYDSLDGIGNDAQ